MTSKSIRRARESEVRGPTGNQWLVQEISKCQNCRELLTNISASTGFIPRRMPGSLWQNLTSATCWSLYTCFHFPGTTMASVTLRPSKPYGGGSHWQHLTQNPAGRHVGNVVPSPLAPMKQGSAPKGEMTLRCPQITLRTVLYCLEETLGTSPENLEGRITYGIFCISSQRLKNRPENDLRCPSTACDFWKQSLKNSETQNDNSLTQ